MWVPGIPAPQGSKRHVGRGIMVESSTKVGPWRERVALAVAEAVGPEHELPPKEAGIVVNAQFVFVRPASHLKRDGVSLRRGRPPAPSMRPDLDKLLRAVLDALTGIAFADDAQVVAVNAGKEYGNVNGVRLVWHVIGGPAR